MQDSEKNPHNYVNLARAKAFRMYSIWTTQFHCSSKAVQSHRNALCTSVHIKHNSSKCSMERNVYGAKCPSI